jgi:hypothetical protein
MKVLRRLGSVLFVAIAAFLIYAVVAAATSSAGARIPVCVGYVVGAILLSFGAKKLWGGRSTGVSHVAA